jgi:hypothetical protein
MAAAFSTPSWMLHLNEIFSPEASPANGPESAQLRTEEALSYPVAGDELSRQLEAWTSVQFQAEPALSEHSTFFNDKVAGSKDLAFQSYFNHTGGPSIDPVLYAPFPSVAPDGSNLLIHPTIDNQATLTPPTPAMSGDEGTPSSGKAAKGKTGSKRGRKPLLPANLDPADPDMQAQAKAIEEDKRRRNTAASGAFALARVDRGN